MDFFRKYQKALSKFTIEQINNLTDEEIRDLAMERPGHPKQLGFMLVQEDFASQKNFAVVVHAFIARLGEIDEEEKPKTIKEATEKFIELWDQDEIDLIVDCKKEDQLDFLYKHIGDNIISRCSLDDNIELREACGPKDTTTENAARVIMKSLWKSIRH